MPTRTEVIAWACFFALGFGGWNVLNSLFLEAPYMVKRLPEGATLSTYLLIAQQIASLIVIVPTQFLGNSVSRFYVHIIVITFIISFLSCAVLMIWSLDSVKGFSLPFLAMAVVTSILGYVSTTYYFPFVSLYRLYCTNAYTLGLGFSLAFTAVISIAQDSGAENPRFDFRGFFGIILASQVVAFIGVLWIILSDGAKTQLVSYIPPESESETDEEKEDPCKHALEEQNGVSLPEQQRRYDLTYKPAPLGKKRDFSSWRVFWKYIMPSLWQGCLAFLAFGIVPSLLYYASGSYYNGDVIYMWSVSLLYIVDPIARVIYSLQIAEFGRTRHVNLLTGICLVFGFLICLLAGMSPDYTWARTVKSAGCIPIILAICCGFTYAGAFTASYTNMFNIGTDASEDDLYDLEVEVDDNEQKQVEGSVRESGVELTTPNLTPANSESITPATPTADNTEEKVLDVAPKIKKGPCPLCQKDSARRDALRQIIYRLAGFSLQIGSCIGTFVGASLTVFTTTIGAPVAWVPPTPVVPVTP